MSKRTKRFKPSHATQGAVDKGQSRKAALSGSFAGGVLQELTGRERIVDTYVASIRQEADQVAKATAARHKRSTRIRALGACLSRELKDTNRKEYSRGAATSRSLPNNLHAIHQASGTDSLLQTLDGNRHPPRIIIRNNVILSGNVELNTINFNGDEEGILSSIPQPKHANPPPFATPRASAHQHFLEAQQYRDEDIEDGHVDRKQPSLVDLIKKNKYMRSELVFEPPATMASSGMYMCDPGSNQTVAYRLPSQRGSPDAGSVSQLPTSRSGAGSTAREGKGGSSHTKQTGRKAGSNHTSRRNSKRDIHREIKKTSSDPNMEVTPNFIQGSKVTPICVSQKNDRRNPSPLRMESDFENFVIASVESCNRPFSDVTIPSTMAELNAASLQSLPGQDTPLVGPSDILWKQALADHEGSSKSSDSTIEAVPHTEWPRGLPSGMKSPDKQDEHLDKMWYKNYLTYVRRKGYGRSKLHDMQGNKELLNRLHIHPQNTRGAESRSSKSSPDLVPTGKPPLPKSGTSKEEHMNAFIADCVRTMQPPGVQNLLYRVYDHSNVPPPTPEVRSNGMRNMSLGTSSELVGSCPEVSDEDEYDQDRLIINPSAYPMPDDMLTDEDSGQLTLQLPVQSDDVQTDAGSSATDNPDDSQKSKLSARGSESLPNICIGVSMISQTYDDSQVLSADERCSKTPEQQEHCQSGTDNSDNGTAFIDNPSEISTHGHTENNDKNVIHLPAII